MNNKKERIALIVGISAPILMILLIVGGLYLPGLMANPVYDFVYVNDATYCFSNFYSVKDGKVVIKEQNPNKLLDDCYEQLIKNPPKFYRFVMKTGASEELTKADLALLTLDTNIKSPDGYELITRWGGGGSIFDLLGRPSSDNSVYLKSSKAAKRIELRWDASNVGYSRYNTRLIGWVKK